MSDEMTGADIIDALLRDDLDFIALLTGAQLKMGALPENAPLPAGLIQVTSSTERATLIRGAFVRTTDRVSFAVRAVSYRDQRRIIKAANRACAGKTGDIGGALRVSVANGGAGPDLRGPGNSFEQTVDFRVSYDAPA